MQIVGCINRFEEIIDEAIKESEGSIDFSIINYTTKFVEAFKEALNYGEEKKFGSLLDDLLKKFNHMKLKNLEDKLEELKNNV